MAPDVGADTGDPVLLRLGWDLEALVPPEAADPLVVHRPALAAQLVGRSAPTPAGTTLRELAEEVAQLGLIVRRRRWFEPLGRAMLADHSTCSSFGHPEPVLQH